MEMGLFPFGLYTEILPSETGIRSQINLRDGFLLFDTQTFCQPAELLVCQFPKITLTAGSLEAASFQSFVQEQKSIAFP